MSDVITFLATLPPRALRGNAKVHWAVRKKAADEYSMDVGAAWARGWLQSDPGGMFPPTSWAAAHVTYTWRYAGVAPDIDNIARSVKVLQDTICCAPANSRQGDYSERYFLGLVLDDGGIEATFRREKVATRAEEGVLVEIRRQR